MLKNNELRQIAPLLSPVGGCGILLHRCRENAGDGGKTRFCGFLYIIYFAHMIQHYFLLFSLFYSFSIFYVCYYFVTFCYSIHYIILFVSVSVSLLKNANFFRCFIILHPVFCSQSKIFAFLFHSVSTRYNVLTFFNKLFCS